MRVDISWSRYQIYLHKNLMNDTYPHVICLIPSDYATRYQLQLTNLISKLLHTRLDISKLLLSRIK